MSDSLVGVRSAGRDASDSSSYDSYWKPDVEDLTAIPSHWDAPRLKYAVESGRGSSGLIKSEAYDSPAPGLYPAFSASGQDVWVDEPTHSGPGIVLSAVGARCGKAFRASGEWGVVANTHVFHPRNQFDRDFLWFLLNDEGFWEKGGTAQPYVQVSASLNKRIPAPPLPEQERIASFLNSRTGVIDDLIAKKERLIELLEEKRTALITKAVTKGLDPDVSMKDSGVEWLGEIPDHWEVVPLGMALRESRDRNEDAPVGEMLSVSGYRGVELKEYDHESRKRSESELRNYRVVRPGQLVVNTMWLNHRGLGVSELTGHVSPAYAVYDIPDFLEERFVHHLLRSDLYVDGYKSMLYGIRPNSLQIKRHDWNHIPLLRPQLSEQQQIVECVDSSIAKMRTLENRVERAVALLYEYRSALITAAVTGKIDVRDHAA